MVKMWSVILMASSSVSMLSLGQQTPSLKGEFLTDRRIGEKG